MLGRGRKQKFNKEFEVNEGVFLDSMKNMVKKQLQQNSDIAIIQDQVRGMITDHDQRLKWSQSLGIQSVLNPYSLCLQSDTATLLLLALFLALQLILQLAFTGRLDVLAPHLPDFMTLP
ncbi:uncharacterized protein [Littorina saxatilis]|uniref:Uncharacterized protein n=1 Tax=Littorina saxatilis TaxID=31220 RepID=A0AAN9G3U1_9CAEN